MKTFIRHTIRSIKQSLSRFLAIFGIVALGVGFLAGLVSTTPDMRLSVDKYLDDSYFYDIRVIGTLGLTDDDIDTLYKLDRVTGVMGTYSADAEIMSGDNMLVSRIESLPVWLTDSKSGEYQNRVELVEGRLPHAENEVVAVKMKMGGNSKIGDVIKLSGGGNLSETLKQNEFVVVGIVTSPMYFSIDDFTSTVGYGTVDRFFYTANEAFCMDCYTNLYVSSYSAKKFNTYSDEYEKWIAPIIENIEMLADGRCEIRYTQVKADSEQELDGAREELKKAEQELDDARAQLIDGWAELQANRTELENGRAECDANEKRLEDAKKEYEDGKNELRTGREELNQQISDAKAEIAANEAKLEIFRTVINFTDPLIDQTRIFAENGTSVEDYVKWLRDNGYGNIADEIEKSGIKTVSDYLEQLINEYDSAKKQLEDGESAIELAKSALEFSRASGEIKLNAAERELDDAQKEIMNGEIELAKARKDIENGEKELESAQKELLDGQTEYDEGLATAEQQLDDAKKQIADGEKQISGLSVPMWLVYGRDNNPCFKGFGENANKIEAIAKVFPVFFFLVAALVALTTMTRMIEEERTQIGTIKALGYSRRTIVIKYLVYAGAATLLGSVCGLAVGMVLFPTVIWNAYGIMYILPKLITPFNWIYALAASGAAFICTMAATFFAAVSTLREEPAKLMRPRAPKAGKRVFLEKIGFIWKHLPFMQKVTIRNLVRYKKRFFMTVIGIAGCTALLVTGFGLNDSISKIAELQFGNLHTYDAIVGFMNNNDTDEIASKLEKYDGSDYIYENQITVDIVTKNNSLTSAYLTVPEDYTRITDFIILRERVSGKNIPFEENSVILTEKLAEGLGISVGDTIRIRTVDNRDAEVKVGGIAENYVYNYIYMSKSLYEACYGKLDSYNVMLLKTGEQDNSAVYSRLLECDSVVMIQDVQSIRRSVSDMMNSINYIVIVLILSAGLLALVVLYNLTNINITERQKEIATLRVLGFYNRETASYIFRETAVLSVIGAAVGLVIGIFLHAFVISTSEVDMVMFGRQIAPQSYLYSALLTFLFTAIVCVIMLPRLRKIDMVESLKAGE